MSELYRKITHLLIIFIPLTYHFYGKWESVKIFAVLTSIIVLVDILRQKLHKFNEIFIKIFGKILKPQETKGDFCGASYVGVAACLCFSLFKPEFAVTSFIILAISDAIAAIFGKTIKSKKFFEKSTAGSIAFFVSAFAVLISCAIFYNVDWWFYILGSFAVFAITMLEARPSLIQIDDNFAIPVGFCVLMTLFDIVLHYQF